ncbi:glycosyltransferase family protein [Mucilaginibacter pedocola]|uniref:Glycosyl transferase family 1 domain-containing protein n=1 Tax=Mucilaginibacter pedocola TaxID=1792845 RepID=A0A1S9P8J9_9SPHI|nr:glycosyltransferase [Mucilaginibacter pedocola]OOQ57157.1 hypothetical protein BC343_16690 [Mucilaginibacter pedocola]
MRKRIKVIKHNMDILGLVGKDSGPGFHRVLMPLLMMPGLNTRITNFADEAELAKGYHTVYYNRHVDDSVVNLCIKKGLKIAVDVDDHWHLPPSHIAYHDYRRNSFAAIQKRHIQQADVVTTTHERLAEQIYPFNKNVVVLPNAIPHHTEYFPVCHTPGERIRLFWQGSITHQADMRLLAPAIKGIQHHAELNRQLMMVLCGYTKHPAWDAMVSTYTNGLKLKGAIMPAASPFEYYRNYGLADICLAPLAKNAFNSFKSNLKVLEAAHSALPVITSKVHPYLGLPVLYANKPTDWLTHIRALVNDEAMRKELGQHLQAHCAQHYDFDTINQQRREALV